MESINCKNMIKTLFNIQFCSSTIILFSILKLFQNTFKRPFHQLMFAKDESPLHVEQGHVTTWLPSKSKTKQLQCVMITNQWFISFITLDSTHTHLTWLEVAAWRGFCRARFAFSSSTTTKKVNLLNGRVQCLVIITIFAHDGWSSAVHRRLTNRHSLTRARLYGWCNRPLRPYHPAFCLNSHLLSGLMIGFFGID